MFLSAGKPLDMLLQPLEIIRFLQKVEVIELPGEDSHGHWKWTGSYDTDSKTYPIFCVRRRNQRANRVSFQTFVGPVLSGEDVHHLCRFRWCVRPQCLEAVTHSEHGYESARHQRTLYTSVQFFGGPLDGEERTFKKESIPEIFVIKSWGSVDTYRFDDDLREFKYDGHKRIKSRGRKPR